MMVKFQPRSGFRIGIIFGLLLIINFDATAQKELFITASAGWKVSYNGLLFDKPLPAGIIQYSNWSGFSSNVGLEYKFSPHWAVHGQIKSAGVMIGVRTLLATRYDTLSNKYITFKDGGAGSQNGHAPAHIQLGLTYYSNPFKKEKFSWLLGGGVAYLINRGGFTPGIQINSALDQVGYSKNYGKHIGLKMEEDYIKNGVLLNLHTGIDFHFAPKHHLLLTLQHNEGLRNIWQFKTNYFYYADQVPSGTTYEYFDIKIRTKGSYSALQLGYKYALTGHKKQKDPN